MKKNTTPVWLFSGLYNSEINGTKQQKWSDEKEMVAQRIIQSIKDVAKHNYWDEKIFERILYINHHDDANMYGITPKV